MRSPSINDRTDSLIVVMYSVGRGLSVWELRALTMDIMNVSACLRWWPSRIGSDSSRLSALREARNAEHRPWWASTTSAAHGSTVVGGRQGRALGILDPADMTAAKGESLNVGSDHHLLLTQYSYLSKKNPRNFRIPMTVNYVFIVERVLVPGGSTSKCERIHRRALVAQPLQRAFGMPSASLGVQVVRGVQATFGIAEEMINNIPWSSGLMMHCSEFLDAQNNKQMNSGVQPARYIPGKSMNQPESSDHKTLIRS
jgi:hypothetical protein